MIGRLPGGGRPLGRIGDDRIRRLVDLDADRADAVEITGYIGASCTGIDDRLQGTGRLVLIKPQLEVHGMDRKGVARDTEFQIERALPMRAGLVEPVDRERIAKHVAGPQEAGERAPRTHHRHLRRERGRRSLAVGELVAGTDRPEGHIVRDHHANRRLDLLDRAAERRCIGRGTGDGSVMNVVDRIFPQRKHLGQPAADLVDKQHHAERGVAIEAGLARGGERHRIKIIVAKLAGGPPLGGVVSEIRAVGIPFANGRGVGGDGLLHRAGPGGAQADAAPAAGGGKRAECLAPQHRRGIGLMGQGRHAAADAIEMKPLHQIERGPADTPPFRRPQKVDAIPGQAQRLVFRAREQESRAGKRCVHRHDGRRGRGAAVNERV